MPWIKNKNRCCAEACGLWTCTPAQLQDGFKFYCSSILGTVNSLWNALQFGLGSWHFLIAWFSPLFHKEEHLARPTQSVHYKGGFKTPSVYLKGNHMSGMNAKEINKGYLLLKIKIYHYALCLPCLPCISASKIVSWGAFFFKWLGCRSLPRSSSLDWKILWLLYNLWFKVKVKVSSSKTNWGKGGGGECNMQLFPQSQGSVEVTVAFWVELRRLNTPQWCGYGGT